MLGATSADKWGDFNVIVTYLGTTGFPQQTKLSSKPEEDSHVQGTPQTYYQHSIQTKGPQ